MRPAALSPTSPATTLHGVGISIPKSYQSTSPATLAVAHIEPIIAAHPPRVLIPSMICFFNSNLFLHMPLILPPRYAGGKRAAYPRAGRLRFCARRHETHQAIRPSLSDGRRANKPVPRNERATRALLGNLRASVCRYFFSGAVTVIVTGRLGMETSVFGFWAAFGSLL
jgi:hypothetical protein